MKISVDMLVQIEREPGEPATVVMGGGDLPKVRLGPYPNPALAEQDADRIKAFLIALAGASRTGPNHAGA
jgi:hypothetical protein